MFMLWWLWDFGRGEQALHKMVFIHRLHKAGVIRRTLDLALRQNKQTIFPLVHTTQKDFSRQRTRQKERHK